MRSILLLLILPLSLSAQVSWFEGSWEEAREAAKTNNKSLFVDAYTLKYAEEAIKLGNESGDNTKYTDELIEKIKAASSR